MLRATTPVLSLDTTSALSAAVREHLQVREDEKPPSFRHALVDLNDDGLLDAVVLMTSAAYCGSGGCKMLVFRNTGNDYKFVSGSTIANTPIRVAGERSHGWSTLIVHVRGGGLAPLDLPRSRGH